MNKVLGLNDELDINVDHFQAQFQILKENAVQSTVRVANKIYFSEYYNLKPLFEKIIKKFDAEVEEMNFGNPSLAAKTINEYVQEKTEGEIKDFINSNAITSNTKLFLVNTVYFAGGWSHPFDKRETKPGKFCRNEQDCDELNIMNQIATFEYAEIQRGNWKAKALQMEFENSNMYFLMILPHEKTGVSDLLANLKGFDIFSPEFEEKNVRVSVPKFKFDYSVDMKKVLRQVCSFKFFN